MKFSQITKATPPRLRGIKCTTVYGSTFELDIGLMSGAQEEIAMGNAQRRAAKLATGGETELNFEMALAVEEILAAGIDPESPDDRPEPFFASAEEILTHLDRERIAYLAETQRAFQDEISPRTKVLSPEAYTQAVTDFALREDCSDHAFFAWPRVTQAAFLRQLAADFVEIERLPKAVH